MTIATTKQPDSRKWLPAVLSGKHLHRTRNGCSVYVVERKGKYMARGRFLGKSYCETLGRNEADAESRLRELLSELEKDTFLPPLERKKQLVRTRITYPLSFTEMLSGFLTDVKGANGKNTAQYYLAKLGHVERFAAKPENSRQWPTVNSIDREFILKLKGHLQRTSVTPNGHAHSTARPMSQRQNYNVLSALGTMLKWAQRPDVRRLPAHWVNPLTRELIGAKPTKDPVRKLAIEDAQLLQLIWHCDLWQLTHLVLSFVYPLRPQEATGLLIEDIDFKAGQLRIGTRFGGDDYTKGKQSFVLPFLPELAPILLYLVDDRLHGPLLRHRKHYILSMNCTQPDTIETAYREKMNANQDDVLTCQDRKRYLRETFPQFGGIRPNVLSKEFKKLMRQAEISTKITLYDLRKLNSTRLNQSGVNNLALRYFTGHAPHDIMYRYVALNPHEDIQPYFKSLQPVLQAITKRFEELKLGAAV